MAVLRAASVIRQVPQRAALAALRHRRGSGDNVFAEGLDFGGNAAASWASWCAAIYTGEEEGKEDLSGFIKDSKVMQP